MNSQMYDVWTDFPTYCRSLVDLLCSCSMRSMRSMRSMQFKAHFDCAVGARVLTLVCPQGSWLRWPRYGRRESWQSWQSGSRCVREYTSLHASHVSHLASHCPRFCRTPFSYGPGYTSMTSTWHQSGINMTSVQCFEYFATVNWYQLWTVITVYHSCSLEYIWSAISAPGSGVKDLLGFLTCQLQSCFPES